jgi:hypothetical protein
MSKKPTVPPPSEPEAVPEVEGEKLPWLQRVEDDENAGAGNGGKAVGLVIGALLLIVAIAAIGFALISRRPAPPAEPESNLAGLLAENGMAPESNEQASVVPAAPAPHHGRKKTAAETPSPATLGRGKGHGRHEAKAAAKPGAPHAASAPAHPHEKAAASGRHEKAPSADKRHETRPALATTRSSTAAHHPAGRQKAKSSDSRDLLQLGAYDNRAGAERMWRKLTDKHLYAGATHQVERATVHGHVYYRLRVRAPVRLGQCARHGGAPCWVVQYGR